MKFYDLLAHGSTILCKTIMPCAIKLFLSAVLPISINHKMQDLMLDDCGQEYRCDKNFICKIKLWQSMPNHREFVDVKMVSHMLKMLQTKPIKPRLISVQIERTRNLLLPSPLQVGIKCLWKEETTHKRKWPATSIHFST